MHEATLYPNIHLKGTGIYLKRLTRQKGYKVRDLQRLLHLSCSRFTVGLRDRYFLL